MENPINMGWFGGKTHYFGKHPNVVIQIPRRWIEGGETIYSLPWGFANIVGILITNLVECSKDFERHSSAFRVLNRNTSCQLEGSSTRCLGLIGKIEMNSFGPQLVDLLHFFLEHRIGFQVALWSGTKQIVSENKWCFVETHLAVFGSTSNIGGGFKHVLFSPGNNDPLWLIFFQMGWFNHQLYTLLQVFRLVLAIWCFFVCVFFQLHQIVAVAICQC